MINPSNLNLSTLPSVPLEDRSQLPQSPCIYFAIDSLGTVQYIGRSVNPKNRWASHSKTTELNALDQVRIAYMFVDDANLLTPIENALIAWFNPSLNKTERFNPFGVGMLGLRLRSGKKAVEIAVELGVSFATVRNWEQLKNVPRMTPASMQKVMGVYGCTLEELVAAELEIEDRHND